MPKETTCQICDKPHQNIRKLSAHLKNHNIKSKDYFIKFFAKEGDGLCIVCKEQTKYNRTTRRYSKYCSNKCSHSDAELIAQQMATRTKNYENNPEPLRRQGEAFKQTVADNPEILIKRAESRKRTYDENPDIRIKANEKRNKTLADNPDIMKRVAEKRLKTYEDNPSIRKNQSEKYKKMLADNPEIMKRSAERRLKTYEENPEIMKGQTKAFRETMKSNPEIQERRNNAHKRTLRNNPDIMKNIIRKSRETIKNNPDIEERRLEKLSISLRNFYKTLYENASEKSHYLYIMENQIKPIIKIGICSEKRLKGRTETISRDFGESKPVLLLKSSYKKIDDLESFLHDYFKEQCVVQKEKKSGRTEWFDKQILAEAIELASAKLSEC